MKRLLSMLVFVVVLGSILTGTLLLVSNVTAPVIEANSRVEIQSSVLDALGIAHGEGSVESTFEREVTVTDRGDVRFYESRDGAVAFSYEGSGLWGPISGIIALNAGGSSLRAVTIIHQEETPGLGGRISEDSYLARFRDRSFEPRLVVTAPGRASGPTEVDGISGATLTSNAFVAILNERLAEVMPIYEEMKG